MPCPPLLLTALLAGCLVDGDLYRARLAELTDDDGDGYTEDDGDCDDTDAGVHPGAQERCDGVDQDCDQVVDEGAEDATSWFADQDGDGHGAGVATLACEAPVGAVAVGDDCDDGDAAISPSAEEIPYDGIDQDCADGDADDLDGDGYAAEAAGGDDCDDGDAGVNPGVAETWTDGWQDNDCNGILDPVETTFGELTWFGASAGAEAGRRMATVGDLDGDGLPDALIGAIFESGEYPNGGAGYLVSGAAGGPLAERPRVLASGEDWYLGTSMDSGVDATGDGQPDVLISASGFDGGSGAAWLISGPDLAEGSNLTLPDDSVAVVLGEDVNDFAGAQVGFVGDITGDGLENAIVSAPYAEVGSFMDAGEVGIFEASGVASAGTVVLDDADSMIYGHYDEARIGNEVQRAGDVDGDGVDDLMVSIFEGQLVAILPGGLGSPSIDTDRLFLLVGSEGVVPSCHPRMLGDIDGDEHQDLGCISLDPGRFMVFTDLAADRYRSTEDAGAAVTFEPGAGGSYGYDFADLGDMDGDGLSETLLPLASYGPRGTSVVALLRGSSLTPGAELDIEEAPMLATSLRPDSGFGYRVVVPGDMDGDGTVDALLGGGGDDEGGEDAGAAAILSLPR